MRKILLILLLSSVAWADGPKHSFPNPILNDELDNVYHDIKYPKIVNLTVTGITSGVAGRVVQSSQTIATIDTCTTSATFNMTRTSATITPSSLSSKILLLGSGEMSVGSNITNGELTFAKNGVNLAGTHGIVQMLSPAAATLRVPVGFAYLDAPASTSALTYEIQMRSSVAGQTVCFNELAGQGVMTVLEIRY